MDIDSIPKYFHKNYKQNMDGKILDHNGFINHMYSLKNTIHSLTINIKHIIVEKDKAATIDIVNGVKKIVKLLQYK